MTFWATGITPVINYFACGVVVPSPGIARMPPAIARIEQILPQKAVELHIMSGFGHTPIPIFPFVDRKSVV